MKKIEKEKLDLTVLLNFLNGLHLIINDLILRILLEK